MLVSSHVLAEVSQTADDVVVIHRGRSIVQAPLHELMAGAGAGVRVAGPDTERLAGLLRADGADVRADGGGALVVRDRSGEDVGRVVAANGIVISELAAHGLEPRRGVLRADRRHGRRPVVTRLARSPPSCSSCVRRGRSTASPPARSCWWG